MVYFRTVYIWPSQDISYMYLNLSLLPQALFAVNEEKEAVPGHDSSPPKAGVQNRSDESCPKSICFFPLTAKGPTLVSSNTNFYYIGDF